MAAKVVNGTTFSRITLLPTDDSPQGKLFDVRFQSWSSLLWFRSDIAIALPASARASFAFRFGFIALHTANPVGVRFQVRSGTRLLVVFVLASNAPSLDFRFAKAIVSNRETRGFAAICTCGRRRFTLRLRDSRQRRDPNLSCWYCDDRGGGLRLGH